LKEFMKRNGVWIGFFVLVIALSAVTHGSFLSARNLTNVLRQASLNGILAAGMTMIILTGGIDLSIGSTVALVGVLVGITQVPERNPFGEVNLATTFGVALLIGTLVGLANGVLIAKLRIAPFVITLGMMVIGRGIALILADGSTISPMTDQMVNLANEYVGLPMTIFVFAALIAGLAFSVYRSRSRRLEDLILPLISFAGIAAAFVAYKGLPVLALFLVGVFLVVSVVLMKTTLGRAIFAVGSNERAAFFSGVPIRTITIFVYTAMGTLSGLAGLLLTARLNGADPNAGQLFELDAIAAVVIGGTSLKGGQGSLLGSLVGALTIASLNNGMDMMGVPSFYQMVLKGFVIILAVALDRSQRQAI
jgi:ribose/xylose/arabinose/galactoside ABC-type transport system permease subunit